MTTLSDQIRTLLADDQTEAALDTLLDWAKKNPTDAYDAGVLLRARWEKIEEETTLGLLSREESMRQTNQVNAAVLALLADLEREQAPAEAPPVASAPARPRPVWPVAALGIVLLGLAGWVVFGSKKSMADQAAPPADTVVRFPQGNSLTLVENGEEVSYQILDAQLQRINNRENRLTLRLLCSPILSPRRAINFWSSSFRFVPAGGEPAAAPVNNLNLLAESHASTEGELQFLLPPAVEGGEMFVKFYNKEASLEVTW